jgi:fermentation-respiration switch protein FrsA (DUF1100 family)
MREVNFRSGLGYKLAGNLYKPRGSSPADRRPAVLVCYGYASWKERYSTKIAERLAQYGYYSLAFDYRGFGASEGPRWRLIVSEQLEDIGNAITFLRGTSGVDSSKICLLGVSLGGAEVVQVGALDARVAGVVSIAPFGDGERFLRNNRTYYEWRRFKLKLEDDAFRTITTGKSELMHPIDIQSPPPNWRKEWESTFKTYPERKKMKFPLESARSIVQFKPELVAGSISPRPLLIVSDREDMLVSEEEQMNIFKMAGEPKEFFSVYFGGHHLHDPNGFEVVMKLIRGWLTKHVPTSPLASAS